MNSTIKEDRLVIVHGGTGDLAGKKTFPGLYKLYCNYGDVIDLQIWADGLPNGNIGGKFGDDEFRDSLFRQHPGLYQPVIWDEFKKRIRYFPGYSTDPGAFAHFAAEFREYRRLHPKAGVLSHFSLHPDHFGPTVENYLSHGLVPLEANEPKFGWTRMLLEKPFALSIATAKRLRESLRKVLPLESFFAFDHYWFKPRVNGLLTQRFANIAEERHNHKYVQRIIIRALESIGVEGRTAYVGATFDMILAHQLLLFALSRIGMPSETDMIKDLHRRMIGSIEELKQPGVITGLQLGRHNAGTIRKIVNGRFEEVKVKSFLDTCGNPHLESAARLTIRPPGTRWEGKTVWELITAKYGSEVKINDIRTIFLPTTTRLFNRGIFRRKNGPNPISRNEILYIIESERIRDLENGKKCYERFGGRKHITNIPSPNRSFGIEVDEEEADYPLKSDDGYEEALVQLLVDDAIVERKERQRATDSFVWTGDILDEEIEPARRILMPVTFQIAALEALQELLARAREDETRWVSYNPGECPDWSAVPKAD